MTTMSKPSRTSPFAKYSGLLTLLFISCVYLIIQAQLPHHTFWSNDGGEKLVQIKALIGNGFTSPALPYDQLGLEQKGSFAFAPFYPGHASVIDDRLMPVVPLYFPLLSSIPYMLWGHTGLYLIPLLCSIVTLYCLYSVGSKIFDTSSTILLIISAGLASPIFFYGLLFLNILLPPVSVPLL